jgi:hypothetical protein
MFKETSSVGRKYLPALAQVEYYQIVWNRHRRRYLRCCTVAVAQAAKLTLVDVQYETTS